MLLLYNPDAIFFKKSVINQKSEYEDQCYKRHITLYVWVNIEIMGLLVTLFENISDCVI